MENKTKLRFFENAWRTDLLTKTEIFRSMLEPYTEEELKELTEDKLVETYNHYADTYLDLIMNPNVRNKFITRSKIITYFLLHLSLIILVVFVNT